MRVIRHGMSGEDVEQWKSFLRGQGFTGFVIDQNFGEDAVLATKSWQKARRLVPDGVIGPRSFGEAMRRGFNPGFVDEDKTDAGVNWPSKPAFGPLDSAARANTFDAFEYVAEPQDGNPERIKILGDWSQKHIVVVDMPQLNGLKGAPRGGKIRLHTKAVEPFRKFFQALDDAGLRDRLKSFGGSWAPRFIRGSKTILSQHAYGSAIDLNVPWNMLGTTPAVRGAAGCVREIVPIANAHGIYWGGHFTRQDGMHFEIAKL